MEENTWKRWKDYVDGLEVERRKIEVFRGELPLSLDLVTQTIESYRQQMDQDGRGRSRCLGLRRPSTVDDEEEEVETEGEGELKWLRSVQVSGQSHEEDQVQVWKPKAIDLRGGRGAFRPFSRGNCCGEKEAAMAAVAPTTPPSPLQPSSLPPLPQEQQHSIAAVEESSTAEIEGGEECGSNGQKGKEGEKTGESSRRKTRRCWSPDLHRRFLNALQRLGGAQSATPKHIKELMKIEGLTSDEVKSHLQKYRLHTRRPTTPATAPSTNAGHQSPQFILLGGIWVPPPEYATSTAPPPGDASNTSTSKAKYAPLPNHNQLKQKFTMVPLQQARGAVQRTKNSKSPATSSSSHSTSTSTHS